MAHLKELLVEELQDLLHAETQLTGALPKMAEAAHNPKLKEAFENHLVQTKNHVERLQQAFTLLGEKAQPALFSRQKNSDRHGKHSQGGDPTHHSQIKRNRKLSHHFSTCSQMHNDCHHGRSNHAI